MKASISAVSDNLQLQTKFQTAQEAFSQNIKNDIQPIVNVGLLYSNFAKENKYTSTGASNILTTPTDKNFFITAIVIGHVKDAACDCGEQSISFFIGGRQTYIQVELVPSVATSSSNLISLPFPLLVDKGTIIQHSGTFGAGTMTKNVTVFGIIQ